MTRLVWDDIGEKLYETGVDQGVLYVQDNTGAYPNGVAWNGLIGVTESPSGAEVTKNYADNIIYSSLLSAEEFGATIEAYTSPKEFDECDGMAQPVAGLSLGQQERKPFGMTYRTIVGNDVEKNNYGYKYHLIYGATASPSERAYTTINDSPESITFSWDITTIPVPSVAGFKPVSSMVIDTTDPEIDATKLAALLDILYGSSTGTDGPRLPLPAEVITLLTPTAP